MAHFAELDQTNIVLRVIVVPDEHEADGENWCNNLLGGSWKQTSYNATIRKNYAGVGYTYDSARGITSGNDPYLLLNSTAAEVTGTNYVDTDTTGFQVTAAAPAGLNASGGTYIFLAIA